VRRTVAHFIDTAEWGGAEQSLLHLLSGLDRERWRPVLFHHAEAGLRPLLDGARDAGVELRAVPSVRGVRSAGRIPALARAIRRERPALLHAHLNWPLACTGGVLAAALAGVRSVATVQLWTDLPRSPTIPLQRRVAAAAVSRYVAVSRDTARRLRTEFRVPERRVRVVPNGIRVPAEAVRPDPALRAEIAGSAERPLVLAVARLERQKGHRFLLEAAVRIPGATFALAGDGPARAELEACARELGVADRVVFLGRRSDVPRLLASCDVFVLPSLWEGLPLAALEAMAAGVPVVATAIGGTDEAVLDGTSGLLVPPADSATLAAAIRRVLDEPALAKRLGEAGRARVRERFSAEAMVAGVAGVYEEVLDGGDVRRG
jgi:glycosyltransferase involved in cell wall biosynthesis